MTPYRQYTVSENMQKCAYSFVCLSRTRFHVNGSSEPNFFARLKSLGALFVLMSSLFISACGGAGSGSPSLNDSQPPEESPSAETTKLMVSMTDAEGDFLTYQVDVSSIQLYKSNGADITVLPQTTTIDFAQYVDVSELLSMTEVPSGRYDSASLTLDFTSALVTVQDEEGSAITAALQDNEGQVLAQVTVDILFGGEEGFVLAPGVPAHVTLDFDLENSNTIVIDGDTAVVTVNPVLIADTILENNKPLRLRGLLEEVDVDGEELSLNLLPFRVRSGDYGTLTVEVNSETSFEINGELVSNNEGLTVLQAQTPATPVITEGSWGKDTGQYTANAVYAGSSVPWAQADILRGTVVGRSGDQVSVRGGIIELAEGAFVFNDTITLTLDETTRFVKRGDDNPTFDDVSVGSAVYATGEAIGSDTFSAADGIVRIRASSLSATLVSVSPMALDLAFVNGRRAALYDYSGTGSSPETDADKDFYEVFTSSLDLSDLSIGDPIRVLGYVTEFGAAPEDLSATTVISGSDMRGFMIVGYGLLGSYSAIVSANVAGIQLSLDDARISHHIVRAGIPVDIDDLPLTPLVVPVGEDGIYTIMVGSRLSVFTTYSDMIETLNDQLNAGSNVLVFNAQGFYAEDIGTFSSSRITVIMSNSN